MVNEDSYLVPPKLLEAFRRDGVVVLPGVFTEEEILEAKTGLATTLKIHEVDVQDLEKTAGNLRKLSTTGGSGGVLDIFYAPWKLRLSENPRFFSAISQLWAATYAEGRASSKGGVCMDVRRGTMEGQGEEREEERGIDATDDEQPLYAHPHGPFDPRRGYFYLDRCGFRVPDRISAQHAKGKRPLQRSLTPHLDCCPAALYTSDKAVPRWRPVQSFVALTDNLGPQTGGFECVKGWHRTFQSWADHRPTCRQTGKAAPCVGDFTPIRPVEDAEVIARFAPVYYQAGSVIAFDWRIPHANATHHVGPEPRQVSYASFLPDVPVNREYARRQAQRFYNGLQPDDQWKENSDSREVYGDGSVFEFSDLGRRLLGFGAEEVSLRAENEIGALERGDAGREENLCRFSGRRQPGDPCSAGQKRECGKQGCT